MGKLQPDANDRSYSSHNIYSELESLTILGLTVRFTNY